MKNIFLYYTYNKFIDEYKGSRTKRKGGGGGGGGGSTGSLQVPLQRRGIVKCTLKAKYGTTKVDN